ncbi:MAG: molybdopterin-dependent oxidoreductase, partial [Chloroflexota bacterium]|nr:molybdopterin-dependent oxidoreductase [Chloroflexota bacterium]
MHSADQFHAIPEELTPARRVHAAAPATSVLSATHAGRAGFVATLLMLATQLVWRLNWSDSGVVQAFPELVVAAISRLTPLSFFGAATENYGSLAKKSLFVAVIIGILALGHGGGVLAGMLSRRLGGKLRGRAIAALAVTGLLLLFTLVVILPIAHLGFFASASSYTSDILTQLVVTFVLFAVAWVILTGANLRPRSRVSLEEEEVTTGELSRRAMLLRAVWSGGTIAAIAGVGGLTWRLLNPRVASSISDTAGGLTTESIIATQRSVQGYDLPTPTTVPATEPAAAAPVEEVASLNSDTAPNWASQALAQDETGVDLLLRFNEMEEELGLTPVLTETRDFYHVSKNIRDPDVDAAGWALTITGLVDRELVITYDELVQRATTAKITTLCCISNTLNGDLVGTAEWLAIPLVELLEEAGIDQEKTVDLRLHASDDYEDSIPLAQGLDPDTLVVVGMNGEVLARDHGYPARLIVPAIYGMKNVKWLDRIEAVDFDFKGYWQTRGWSDPAVYNIWGRIDFPRGGRIAAGPATTVGVASAGDRGIDRVEVSFNDGETWTDAVLEPALNPPFTWIRWALDFDAEPGEYAMRIRATDGAGEVMDETQRE